MLTCDIFLKTDSDNNFNFSIFSGGAFCLGSVCKPYKCIVSSFAKCMNLYEREVCLHQNVGQIHVHFT